MKSETSKLLHGTTWQILRTSVTPASHVTAYLVKAYENMLSHERSNSLITAYNSMHNLHRNTLTVAQLCEWVERHFTDSKRISQRDLHFIAFTIARIA